MNHTKWIGYFVRNKQNRPEPDWQGPVSIPAKMLPPLLKSIEQFRLGDGGGPASLIAFDAERFRGRTEEMRQIVDLWFAEEAEHARLLGEVVKRLGGRFITSHWSFSAFCFCRRVLGVRFELQVLLLTELVSTAYYKLLRRHSPDAALTAVCELILRDESGHVAFHLDRLADESRTGWRALFWEAQFVIFGLAAATMLWINHRPGVTAIGGSTVDYYLEVSRQLRRFVLALRRRAEAPRTPAKWAAPHLA